MKKTAITTSLKAGPYSPAIVLGEFVFCSGQIPIKEGSEEVIRDDIAEATACCLDNLSNLLALCGCCLEDVVKTTVYLTDRAHIPIMNEVYGRYFSTAPPARSTVVVHALPKEATIEIDALAIRPPMTAPE